MDVRTPIGMALLFLNAARVHDGWWWDFHIAPGASDEWVTAYVGSVLAAIPRAEAQLSARSAWDRLSRHRWWSPGWGYNGFMPADADSTAWALRLAESIGASASFRVRRAYRFLSTHVHENGGVKTFAGDRWLRFVTPYPPSVSFSGWCGSHPCVSAAVAGLRLLPFHQNVRQYLRNQQATDGGWNSYWWCDREYSTALAVEALAHTDQPADRERICAAAEWAQSRLERDGCVVTQLFPDGSAFATALAVHILVLCEERSLRKSLDRAIGWLLHRQQAHGSWPSSAAMRLPPPSLSNPDEYPSWVVQRGGAEGTISLDDRAVFTTATVVKTLCFVDARLHVS
jgi:squalene-hopene/tetraprenyl-beta-curcumene cyclase